MKGIQKSAYQQTMEIADKIEDGFYGQKNDFNTNGFFDDFEDIYNDLIEIDLIQKAKEK